MSSSSRSDSSMLDSLEPPQRFFALVVLGLLLMGLGMGAYEATKRTNGSLCTSCLGLDPKPFDFDMFWTKYPSRHEDSGKWPKHPGWIEDDLEEIKVVFLFFWSPHCDNCEEQWEDMKEDGIVKGSEDDGEIGDEYQNNVKLYSMDSNTDNGKRTLEVYEPDGRPPEDFQLPTTVIITKYSRTSETVYWYADNAKLKASLVEEILDAAIDNERGIESDD